MNAYPEVVESKQGKTVVAVRGTPGLRPFTLIGTSPARMRALYTATNGRCFAVNGNALVELTTDGGVIGMGFLATQAGPVVMADNGISLFVVDGLFGYHSTFVLGGLAQITDVNFPGSSRVAYLDGYFLYPWPASMRFGWTNLFSVTFDPLNFASAEGSPDLLVTLAVLHREAWLLGTQTGEVWSSSGDLDQPFVRNQSVFLEQGCAAAQSLARVGESLCWLGTTRDGEPMVMQATGYQPQRISTHPVEQAIAGYEPISDALGWGEQHEGHLLYVLTFPAADVTWAYDLSTGLWHQRGGWDRETGYFTRHPANCYCYAHRRHLVGDYQSGRVWSLDPQTYDNDGEPLVLEVSPPPLFDAEGLHRIAQSRLELDAEVGVGVDGGVVPGSEPHIGLLLSNDGGQTWGTEIARTLGARGRTRHHIEWHRLGTAFDRRCKLRVSDPIKRVFLGLVTDVEVLQ